MLRGRGNPAEHRLELDSERTARPAPAPAGTASAASPPRRLQARAVLEGRLSAGGRSWPPAPEAPLDWQGSHTFVFGGQLNRTGLRDKRAN